MTQTIIDFDWLYVAPNWDLLHHATIAGLDPEEDVVEQLWDGLGSNVTLDCGAVAERAEIPGIFSRMSTPRCASCCEINGLPEGIGSPKNDMECRAILRMDDPAEFRTNEGEKQ